MARVHLYKGVYKENPVTFNTCIFNFEGASPSDYSTPHIGESTLPTTGEPIKLIYFTVTTQGIDKLVGYDAKDAILPPYVERLNGDQVDCMAVNTQFTQITSGVKPEDWELRWRDKYYRKNTTTRGGITVNYPTAAGSEWEPLATYYVPNGGYEPQIQYFSDSLLYFGIGRYIGPIYEASMRFDVNILDRGTLRNGAEQFFNTFWWRAPGINGTNIGSADSFGIWANNSHTPTSADYTNKDIVQLISFTYDSVDYIGVVYIKMGIDNIPTEARITAIGAEAFKGESGGGYDGPISEPGGGNGTYDDESDVIRKREENGNIAGLFSSGSYNVYSLNTAEIGQFFQSAFQTSFWDSFDDRMQAITQGTIDCYMLPYGPGPTSGSEQISLCGTQLENTSAKKLTTSQNWINFGVLNIPRYYDTFLDFAPYTSMTIFLPFVGTFELPVNEFIGGQIQCYYIEDFLTGDITAFVECLNQFGDDHLVGQFTGNGKYEIPIVAGQRNNAGWLAAAGATAGIAGGAMGGAKIGSMIGSAFPGAGNLVGGAIGAAVGGGLAAIPGLINTAQAGPPVNTQVIGKMTGAQGWTGFEFPYISITRAMYDQPETFQRDKGYPSNVSSKIRDLSGFNIVSNFNADNITGANDAERSEILQILTTGFYV